jgi:hypothetical protein
VCDLVSKFVDCAAPARLSDVATSVQNKAISVCRVDDPVCDTSQLVSALLKVVANKTKRDALINAAIAIHTNTYQTLKATTTAGKLVGRLIARS